MERRGNGERERIDRDRFERFDRERSDRDRERVPEMHDGRTDRGGESNLARGVDRERERNRRMERVVGSERGERVVFEANRPGMGGPLRGGPGAPHMSHPIGGPRPHSNFKPQRGGLRRGPISSDFPKRQTVDRTKVCPFLLRVFPSVGKHHDISSYQKNKLPEGEVNIHTWKDADMRQIADLVKQVYKEADQHNVELRFAFVYTDPRGEIQMKEVGAVHSVTHHPDDKRTLSDFRFMIGDYLDIAVVPSGK